MVVKNRKRKKKHQQGYEGFYVQDLKTVKKNKKHFFCTAICLAKLHFYTINFII